MDGLSIERSLYWTVSLLLDAMLQDRGDTIEIDSHRDSSLRRLGCLKIRKALALLSRTKLTKPSTLQESKVKSLNEVSRRVTTVRTLNSNLNSFKFKSWSLLLLLRALIQLASSVCLLDRVQ